MSFTPIQPDSLPVPGPPYSPATRAGDTLYISGQLPRDDTGEIVSPRDIQGQTRFVLSRIDMIARAAGGSLCDIAMVTVVLRDRGDRPAFDEEYAIHFPGAKPARICTYGELTRPEALVEIAAIAHLG